VVARSTRASGGRGHVAQRSRPTTDAHAVRVPYSWASEGRAMEGPGMSEPQPPQVMEDVRPFKFSNAEVERYVDNALASLDESDKRRG
jgi:hypothetical protein